MLKQNYRKLVIFFAIALSLACAPIAVATPPAAPPPTIDILLLNTTIAQTAGAAATQTFVLLPTLTPSPTVTRTPTEVPSSTPTFLFIIPTSTVPSSTPTLDASAGPYACRVVSQTPGDGTAFPRKAPFEMHWLVLNTGTATWDINNADYRYLGGDQLHKVNGYDFNQSVSPGSSVDLVVAMQAPGDPGTFTTKWQIASGKERFCTMSLRIVVNQ
jgi:hypothetical protein